MKYLKNIGLPFLYIILILFLVRLFRVVPASKLWNGYSVMYVQKDANQNQVAGILNQYGCKGYICLENQGIPLVASHDTPEYWISQMMPGSTYMEERNNYFFDKDRNYAIYYVPDNLEGELRQAVKYINENGISAGINANSSYPWIAIVISIIFAAVLIYFSERRILLFCLVIVPLYFTFNMPFYTVAAAQCLFMLFEFFSIRFWKRQGAAKALFKNLALISISVVSFAIILLSNIKVTAFYLLAVTSVFAIMYLFRQIDLLMEERYSFRPVPIRSATFMNVITQKNKKMLFYCFIAIAAILISAFLSMKNLSFESQGGASVMLPSKVSSKKSLPDMDDYVKWNWEATVFPYKSLNENAESVDSVIFPRFKQENGLISESFSSITFNENFKQNAVNSIDDLNYNSIESLIKKQGSFSRAGYSASGSSSLSAISFALLFIAMAVPGIFYFLFSGGIKKRSRH